MLGFSDGTKDGGYLMANWSIYRAEDLTAMARQYDVKVIFFDGRGGPPARGGEKTHKFYASLGSTMKITKYKLLYKGKP
jgi:phosphoenolpyruvate carboxylase